MNATPPSQRLSGLFLVDKPEGMTSHDVVSQVRKILQTKEVGHSGTLDPMASGLMVLLIGEATKLSSYVTDGDKTYQVKLKLGIETDTLDATGEILKTSAVNSKVSDVLTMASQLVGELNLPVPRYSAKKIDGKKMYEYARENVQIAQPDKVMTFCGVQSVNQYPEHVYEFVLSCSKGSFIRSWVETLGKRLGCGAVMTGLRRQKSHQYSIDQAITLEALKAQDFRVVTGRLVPLVEALNGIKKIKVKDMDLNLLKNGQISQNLRTNLIRVFDPESDEIVRVHSDRPEALIALVGVDAQRGFVIRRIFNN